MLFNLSQTCLYALAKANHYRNAGISNCIVFKEKYNLFVYLFFHLQFRKFKNIQDFLEFAVVSVKTDRKNSLTLVCGTLRFCPDIEDYRSSKVQRKYSRFWNIYISCLSLLKRFYAQEESSVYFRLFRTDTWSWVACSDAV